MKLVLVLVTVLQLITTVTSHASGAGSGACGNLKPGHGYDSQPLSTSPYTITVSNNQYSAGGKLQVTITGTESFNGFMLIASDKFDETVGDGIGTFKGVGGDAGNSKSVCGGGSLTHTKQLNTDKFVAEWTAPSDLTGNVIFYGTVLKEYQTYWVLLATEGIWSGNGPSPPPLTRSTVAPVTSKPIPSVSNAECGKTKGCFSSCTGNQCDFLLTFTKSKDSETYDFELFASNVDGYVALGIAPTQSMEDVSIIACTQEGVRQYYSAGRNSPIALSQGPVSTTSYASAGGADTQTVSCSFSYDNEIAKGDAKWKDLEEPIYIFIAYGPYYNGELGKHPNIPFVSSEPFDLPGYRLHTASDNSDSDDIEDDKNVNKESKPSTTGNDSGNTRVKDSGSSSSHNSNGNTGSSEVPNSGLFFAFAVVCSLLL